MTLYKLVFSYAYNMGVSTHLAGMRMCVYCEREENLRTPCRCLVGAGSFGMADFSVRMCCWNHERCDCLRHSKVEPQERLELRRAKFHVVVRAYKREPNSHDEFTELKVHAFEEDVSANSACRAKLSKISDTIRCITRSERICSQAQLTERKVHSRCRHHEPCANGFDPKNIGPCSISWLNRFRRLTS
jgi:hypothetical protein